MAGQQLIGKENQRLPMKPGEIAPRRQGSGRWQNRNATTSSWATQQRLRSGLKRNPRGLRNAAGPKDTDEPSGFGVILADARDRIGCAERALA